MKTSFRTCDAIVALYCCFSYFCRWLSPRGAKWESARPALQLSRHKLSIPSIFFQRFFFFLDCLWGANDRFYFDDSKHATHISTSEFRVLLLVTFKPTALSKDVFLVGSWGQSGLFSRKNDPMYTPVVGSRLFSLLVLILAALRSTAFLLVLPFYPKNPKNLLSQSS